MGTTPKGIWYPDDYTQAADVPLVLQQNAESIDAAMSANTDFPGYGTPVGLGDSNQAGVATSVPRADHVHKRPTPAEIGAIAGTVSTAAASGTQPAGYVWIQY